MVEDKKPGKTTAGTDVFTMSKADTYTFTHFCDYGGSSNGEPKT